MIKLDEAVDVRPLKHIHHHSGMILMFFKRGASYNNGVFSRTTNFTSDPTGVEVRRAVDMTRATAWATPAFEGLGFWPIVTS